MKYTTKVTQNSEFNIREAASKSYMGITAFLRQGEPWLVVAFDKKNGHTLLNRDGAKVTLKTPFDWIEATDRSRLVAALCGGECSIPGTPHYSFDDDDWFFRVADDIFEAEEIIEYMKMAGPPNPRSIYDMSILDPPLPSSNVPFDPNGPSIWDYGPDEQRPVEQSLFGNDSQGCSTHYREGNDPNCPACQELAQNQDANLQRNLSPFEGHQVQTPDSRIDERGDSKKCPNCGSHTIGNRIAEFSDDGKPIFHCKTCGSTFPGGEHVIVNPKLTYQVDNGTDFHPYAPGPDDPKKVCDGCGYSWEDHHQFSVTGGKCPHCGHKQEDVMAMEGRHSTFENNTQDSMSGHDTGAVNQSNPTEYRGTDITDGASNVTAPINTFQGPEGLFAVKGTPDQIEGVNWQGSTHGPFSVLPEDVQKAQQFLYQAKIARKAFSPSEQQDLIDENMGGEARNTHKLNLENTHYLAKQERDPYLLWW